jgi:hypothetical protein
MTEEQFQEVLKKCNRGVDQMIYAYGAHDEHEVNRRMRGLNEGLPTVEDSQVWTD